MIRQYCPEPDDDWDDDFEDEEDDSSWEEPEHPDDRQSRFDPYEQWYPGCEEDEDEDNY